MWTNKTDRILHEWFKMEEVLNLDNYRLGDYKMFLCDRRLKGEYLEWAKFLLRAEQWKQKQLGLWRADEEEKTEMA